MFLFCVLSFFKKGDTIQEETLFKGGLYLRKYGNLSKGGFNTLNCISFAGRTHTIESFEIMIIIQHCDKNHFK